MLIDQCPAIRKAALNIAYDNGMVNRMNTEQQFMIGANEVLKEYTDYMAIENFLATLTDEQLDTLCTGEEQEQVIILRACPIAAKVNDLLEAIFYS